MHSCPYSAPTLTSCEKINLPYSALKSSLKGSNRLRNQFRWFQNCTFCKWNIHKQSIKKPNFLNSEPASARSTLAMVALCSGYFRLYSDASSIMPCQSVIELDALEWVVCSSTLWRIFCKLKNEGYSNDRITGQEVFCGIWWHFIHSKVDIRHYLVHLSSFSKLTHE
jgi:hypothetical protein